MADKVGLPDMEALSTTASARAVRNKTREDHLFPQQTSNKTPPAAAGRREERQQRRKEQEDDERSARMLNNNMDEDISKMKNGEEEVSTKK